MKYTCMAYLINRSCILRKEFLRKKMVLHNILTFNVDTAAAVKLKLPFKALIFVKDAGIGRITRRRDGGLQNTIN